MRIRLLVTVVAVVALMASACSASSSHASLRDPAVAGTAQERATPPSTSEEVDQTQRLAVAQVDAESGGVVELADRARLTIPPGALTADADVRLTAIGAVPSAIAFPLEQPVAPALNVEIRGAELNDAATLELLFDPDQVDLPGDPLIATASQWVDIEWLLMESSIDADRGVVTTTSVTPNGWWRPSVWDWSRLPAVVGQATARLDDATVAEPECTTPVPAWVERVELGQASTAPAYLCAGGFRRQLALRMTNHRPFSLAVESSQSPAWGWTGTHNQMHLRLAEIVRSVQPAFSPQLILPRLTEGAIGIDPGSFAGGRIVGRATSTTMAIDVAGLVLEAVAGGADLDGWEPFLACAIPSEDGPVEPDQAAEVVRRISRCVRQPAGSEPLPPGHRAGALVVIDQLDASDDFAAAVESMMAPADHVSGVLYWTDPDRVGDEPSPAARTRVDEREPLPLPPAAFAPSAPAPSPAPSGAAPNGPAGSPAAPPATAPSPAPPATAPPVTNPPTTQPPVTQPPVTVAPTTVPATAAPTTAPPTTERERKRGRGRKKRDADD